MIEKVRFKSFYLNKNYLILKCEMLKKKELVSYPIKINDGCITPDIKTFDGNMVSINFLEKDDIIHINIINDKIDCITLQQKYDLYSDSDSDELFNSI